MCVRCPIWETDGGHNLCQDLRSWKKKRIEGRLTEKKNHVSIIVIIISIYVVR